MSGCLDNGVEQHDSRLLGDDLFGGEMMLDELRDGGESRPFKAVLTLPERESESIDMIAYSFTNIHYSRGVQWYSGS